MIDPNRFRADRFDGDGKFYVFDTHDGGAQFSRAFDTIGDAIADQDRLNADPPKPLQRFTIEIAGPPYRRAVDVFIRNRYDDEMLLHALVERGAVSAAGYDAIYPRQRVR